MMKKRQYLAVIVTGEDAHASEYPAQVYNLRQWFSGFSGSAGILVFILSESIQKVALFTDSRYFIEATEVLCGSSISLFKVGLPGVPKPIQWIKSMLEPGNQVAVSGESLSYQTYKKWESELKKEKIELVCDNNFFSQLPGSPLEPSNRRKQKWSDAFALPCEVVSSSYSSGSKRVQDALVEWKSDAILFSALDQIAWLLNLRGDDIPFNPLFYSYFLVTKSEAVLYLINQEISAHLHLQLKANGICIKPYPFNMDEIQLPSNIKTISVHCSSCCVALVKQLQKRNYDIQFRDQFFELEQMKKSDHQLSLIKQAMVADGLALMRGERLIGERLKKDDLSEWEAAKIVDQSRLDAASLVANKNNWNYAKSYFLGPSFETIAASGKQGAMVHYNPNPLKPHFLSKDESFLLDSGGQYLFGTTDITRVFIFKKPKPKLKRIYTLVLKAHISLARQIFPKNTTTIELDGAARSQLRCEGLDYLHGTGHGVGFVLNVHEGPISLSPRFPGHCLQEGMIFSNEPGCYLENELGVRIENLVVVKKHPTIKHHLYFENLTLYPYEIQLIDKKMLCLAEKEWINQYHKTIWKALAPYLSAREKIGLKKRIKML